MSVPFKHLTLAARRYERRLFESVRLTGPQMEMELTDAQFAAWRDANRTGKTESLARDLWLYARGMHPKQEQQPPFHIGCMGTSWQQMVPMMARVWKYAPKDELSPESGFRPGFGITGHPRRLVLDSGPGAGVVINFATFKQGSTAFAGAEWARYYGDEPIPQSVYGEVQPRLFDNGGGMRLYFTPTPESPPLKYLVDLVEAGEIWQLNRGLTEETIWPIGAPAPRQTQAKIDQYEKGIPSNQRDQRMGRSWFATGDDAVLGLFDETVNVVDFPLSVAEGATLVLGVDHGRSAGKQAAVLVAVRLRGEATPMVWWLGEAVRPKSVTKPSDDARAILAMLKEVGVEWDDIDHVVGDNPIPSINWEYSKSNKRLAAAIADELKRPADSIQRFEKPNKYPGSVSDGQFVMNLILGECHGSTPYGLVHPRCQQLIAAFREHNGGKYDPHKDVFDAGRYPVEFALGPRMAALIGHH